MQVLEKVWAFSLEQESRFLLYEIIYERRDSRSPLNKESRLILMQSIDGLYRTMESQESIKRMTQRRGGEEVVPLAIFTPNENYIVAVYQGGLSPYDILIKYRQRTKDNKWSRIRTPKHIHWAVDMLTKTYSNRELTQQFLDFLIGVWAETISIKTEEARAEALDIDLLLNAHRKEVKKYKELNEYGEYRIEFLILLAKLLMIQERTNREDAYMFGRLLQKLRKGEDIFSIISTATLTRR